MLKVAITAGLALAVAGCASSDVRYQPPSSAQTAQTERTINMPFDRAWDQYVEGLSRSFFVINNISKESRIINVSFSTNQPSELIDCGVTTRIARAPAIGEETWEYAAADSSYYRYGIEGTNLVGQVKRETSLEGRANIFIAPEGQDTLLRVNALYVFSVSTSLQDPRAPVPQTSTWSVNFSSAEEGPLGDGATCVSTGALERQLMSLI